MNVPSPTKVSHGLDTSTNISVLSLNKNNAAVIVSTAANTATPSVMIDENQDTPSADVSEAVI